MLNRPDEKVLKALHSLKFQQDWKTVRSWLEDSIAKMRKESDSILEEVPLRWNQGACCVLDTLLEYETKTKEILEKVVK